MTTVISTVHPNDGMMNSAGMEAYLAVGRTAADTIEQGLSLAEISPQSVHRIMDFACGYGRVVRHLRSRFPHAEIVAADFDAEASQFCADTFDAQALTSGTDFDAKLTKPVDLIWVGSLHTHLDVHQWPQVNEKLESYLSPGGLLFFTTAGPSVFNDFTDKNPGGVEVSDVPRMRQVYNDTGFTFGLYSTKTLTPKDPPNWGRTMVRYDWVEKFINEQSKFELLHWFERGYGRRQDVYMCRLSK